MEAHRDRSGLARRMAASLALVLLPSLTGASYRTTNFVVEANTPEVAKRVGDHAEACRVSIARAWLGHELPAWSTPCPVKVKLTRGEAGGLTSFGFSRGRFPTSR